MIILCKHGSKKHGYKRRKESEQICCRSPNEKDDFKDSFEALRIMGYDLKSIVESLAKEYCVPQTAAARRIEELKLR